MRQFLIIILLVFSSLSCSDDNFVDVALQGDYEGTFERVVEGNSVGTSEVSLVFAGNSFSGSSNSSRFPAICQGSFNLEGNTVNFINNCFFTADFDWSLILSGEFQVRRDGQFLIFERRRDNLTDRYRIRKKG